MGKQGKGKAGEGKEAFGTCRKRKKNENIEADLNFEKPPGFTMYFTNSLGISFLANTMDLNYQMRRNTLSSLLLLLTWL